MGSDRWACASDERYYPQRQWMRDQLYNVSASNNGVLALFPDSAAVLTVTGFTFNNGFTNGQYPVGINLPTTTPYAQPVRIYNVTFNTNGAGGTMLNTNGIGPYLIDHNTFNTNVDAAELMHLNGPGNDNVDVVPGSENMGIIENNTCVSSNPSSIYSQFEESFNGAAYTLRYNQWTGCQLDAHAGNGAGGPGGRWWEIYGNQYNQCCASGSKFDARGGTGVFWGNTQINDPSDADIGLGPLCGSSDPCGAYPVAAQFGTGIGGTSYSPAYIWGSAAPQTNYHVTTATQVQEGSSPTSGSCSGLGGISPYTCNAIVTATEPSTLLRCESAADKAAGCPVSYTYTPYHYPHPSDNCSTSQYGSGATCGSSPTPAAPQNLLGTVFKETL